MMRTFLCLPLLMLLMLGFASCQYEMSNNGSLDGYWQLARIDTLQGGSRDMTTSRQFWSVQVRMLQLSDQNFILPTYIFRFEHRGDSLHIYQPYQLDRSSADVPVTDASLLAPYGLHRLQQGFFVERLDAECLSLRTDSTRLLFKRY